MVDAPPIYIQEKIVPQVIIENLRKVVEKPQLTCSTTSTACPATRRSSTTSTRPTGPTG